MTIKIITLVFIVGCLSTGAQAGLSVRKVSDMREHSPLIESETQEKLGCSPDEGMC